MNSKTSMVLMIPFQTKDIMAITIIIIIPTIKQT